MQLILEQRYKRFVFDDPMRRCYNGAYGASMFTKLQPYRPFKKHDFCGKCLKELMPVFRNLQDVAETIIYVNYLERSINVIRNKDYWPDANDAGKGGIESLRRNIRNRASISAPQALEEHYRLSVFRDQNRNVPT